MARNCSVAATLELIGEQWSLLALREVFLGVRRFDAIADATGAPRAVLVRRLRTLVETGILERVDYREPGARTRQEYRLTSAGRELQPVLTALMQWGDKHLAGPDGPPLAITHTECGEPVRATLCCAAGHHLEDTGRELTATPR
ncbi:winged helix-turn-helix transcriptional regulator [Nocardia heshunensis]